MLVAGHIRADDRVADADQGIEGVLVEREIEGREFRVAARLRPVDRRQLAGVSIQAGLAGVAGAGLQPLADERQHRVVSLGRQIQLGQRGRHDLRRRRLEVEQEAQRVGQIEIREVAQDFSLHPAVEEARKDRAPQQVLAPARVQIEHGVREAREHDPCDARIERGKERRDIAELLRQRIVRRSGRVLIVGQPEQHRSERGGVVDQQGEIDQRHRGKACRGVEAHPALVGRIQVIDRTAAGEHRLTPGALLVDQCGEGFRGGIDRHHFRPVGRPQGDARDTVLGEQLDQIQVLVSAIAAGQQVEAEMRELARRRVALDADLGDTRGVEPAGQLGLDHPFPGRPPLR